MSSQHLSALEEAWRRDPPAAFVRLAHGYRDAGRIDEADEVLRHGLAACPGHLSARVLRATLLADSGDGQGALRELGDVLAALPRHWSALRLAADLLHRAGDAAGERDALQRMTEMNPEAAWVRVRLASIEPGTRPAMPAPLRAAIGKGDTVPSSARPAAQVGVPLDALTMTPDLGDDPFSNATMADVLAAQGDVEGALVMLAALVRRDPDRQSLRERFAELGGDPLALPGMRETSPSAAGLEAALDKLMED